MSENKNELKFLELVSQKFFTVSEDGSVYWSRCRMCGSECSIKMNYQMGRGGKYNRVQFSYKGISYHVLAHRAVYMFFHGEIPNGMLINHKAF
jgi:hypothetical protein